MCVSGENDAGAARKAEKVGDPSPDNCSSAEYKKAMAGVLVARAIAKSAGTPRRWRFAMKISVTVNGMRYERDVEPRMLLAYSLREELRLTGMHVGCVSSTYGAA